MGTAGTAELWKTTDGGWTWNQINFTINSAYDSTFYDGVMGFAFKDSLTGWLTAYCAGTGVDGCFKTMDGGETWYPIPGTDPGCHTVYYHRATDRLFLGRDDDYDGLVSTDDGTSWQDMGVFCGSCSFASDSIGICTGTGQANQGVDPSNSVTTNGGVTWTHVNSDLYTWRPLAIKGTETFYLIGGSLERSDDGGKTWMLISGANEGTDQLYGDSNHIYTQNDQGVFVVSDSGHSWQSLYCGPAYGWDGITSGFYQHSNYIYASGMLTSDSGPYKAQLWMLNLDSVQLNFSSSTSQQFLDGSKLTTITPGSDVTMNFLPTTDIGFGIDSAHFSIHYDSNSLALANLSIPSGWSIIDSSSQNGILNLWLTNTADEPLPAPRVQLTFTTFLSVSSTKIYLDSVNLIGQQLSCDNPSHSLALGDSVQINFAYGCGDSLLLAAMSDSLPFYINNIIPNPASINITISLAHQSSSSISFELFDASGHLESSGADVPSILDVSTLKSGIYYLRLSQNGYVQTHSVVIER